jgi:hypothetical protein
MKGLVLTLDSVISLLIMITVISLLMFFRTESTSPFFSAQQLHSLSEDALTIMSESTLREVASNNLIDQYLFDGILNESDLDKKAIDIIGALWAANRTEAANITKDILESIMPDNVGYQILINGDNVYNSSDTTRPSYDASTVEISSARIASGYEKYKPTTGYVARAWATKLRKITIKIIPINLAWGGYSDSRYWYNGYGPTALRGMWSMILKNFTIPNDVSISFAYLQMGFDNDYTYIKINGNQVFYSSALRGAIREINITDYVLPGINTVNITFRNLNNDIAHFHPGCYIKIKYNTSEVESGKNETVFNADWVRGAPAANEIIPFFVNAPIKNVTSFIEVKDINAFLLLTLNYKYNYSDPFQNVLLYREYPTQAYCDGFLSQVTCEAYAECYWDNSPNNNTIFHATFDGWSTSSNCGGATSEGWSDCRLGEGTIYWRATPGTDFYNSSSIRYHEGNDIDTNNATWITKCLDLSSYSNAYVTFWYNKTSTSSTNERHFILVNNTGTSTFIDLWGSTTSASHWTYNEINITNYISPYTCIRYMAGAASGSSERLLLDDFKIIGTLNGGCKSTEEDIKHRKYKIYFNETGTLIEEYNSVGSLLNTWFNTNITLDNIYNDKTNTLGIYADIRPPRNDSVIGTNDVDWQRLGMYANDNTDGHENDYYTYITENSNVTVYHDVERYGLEYGKIDVTSIENFTDTQLRCESKDVLSCKDAVVNLTFPFTTSLITSRVIGTQSWGGNDNGYNFVWIWDEGEQNESNVVLDTDTPPGTFTYLPVMFFELDKINYVRVGDKDDDRYLNTEISTLFGNKRSIIEYVFSVPSQVGYGDVFENQTDASNDAINRLDNILGNYAHASDIQTESYSVSNIPYMWGPVSVRVRLWG